MDTPRKPFKEYMAEERYVDRWFVIKVAISGILCGILFTSVYFILSATPSL